MSHYRMEKYTLHSVVSSLWSKNVQILNKMPQYLTHSFPPHTTCARVKYNNGFYAHFGFIKHIHIHTYSHYLSVYRIRMLTEWSQLHVYEFYTKISTWVHPF